MNLIDSSFWIEYYLGSENKRHVNQLIDKMNEVIVPTIVVYEVFKKLLISLDEQIALKYIAQMKKGKIVTDSIEISLNAARYGKDCNLAMADSIIYATAQKYKATLYTMDKHFKDLPDVKYFEKE